MKATAVFGVDCDNMLQAQASARRAMKEMADLIEWTHEIESVRDITHEVEKDGEMSDSNRQKPTNNDSSNCGDLGSEYEARENPDGLPNEDE